MARTWLVAASTRDEDDEQSSRRERVIAALARWHRYQFLRLILGMTLAWIVGAVGIHLAERGDNPGFDTLTESFWSVWVMLFSGLESAPKTTWGRIFAMLVLSTGVGLAGLFTGAVASVLVANQLRKGEMSHFEMENHLVLCNWGQRGLGWIREVHSKVIQEKRPIVIVHDNIEQIDLPDKQDDPAFNGVYLVKGDCTSEIILRRAGVHRAHSVVVLIDDRQGEHADGKSILTCIAIRNICRSDMTPNVAVECRNPNNRLHLLKAGADEIIASDELGLRLLARTAIYHGMTRVYQELLTVNRNANEMYLYPVPDEMVGRNFVEIATMFLAYRDDRRSCLLVGLQRGEEMILNPIDDEAGPVKAGDHLILMSRVVLNGMQPMPTVPAISPDRAES